MTVSIPLTRGMVALIDEEDAEQVLARSWHSHRAGNKHYARARLGQSHIYLHRFLMGCDSKEVVDHVNGDGLDNRRCNLRVCSQADNQKNRTRPKARSVSGFIGVSFDRNRSKWIACVRSQGRTFFAGRFDTAVEAAMARDALALELFGEYAGLNFPQQDLPGMEADW